MRLELRTGLRLQKQMSFFKKNFNLNINGPGFTRINYHKKPPGDEAVFFTINQNYTYNMPAGFSSDHSTTIFPFITG